MRRASADARLPLGLWISCIACIATAISIVKAVILAGLSLYFVAQGRRRYGFMGKALFCHDNMIDLPQFRCRRELQWGWNIPISAQNLQI
ncbi:hypothetical protein SKAU_G00282610 [Synaphobranchus kaupii]|uniref:Uncharacterized protein n=1 Tax=Synaphobranchus kaupii TaxID=118154 RepID=A0A9Q1EXF1_SYNKA|nr:hypothetical protein SKAU_G00282610 [Synaphobranchus kaupii]